MSTDIAPDIVKFGLNLLGAVVVVAFKNYLSRRPSHEIRAAAISIVALAFVGFALGAGSVFLRDTLADWGAPFGTQGAEVSLMLVCLGLALSRFRSHAGLLTYELEVLALWAPFIAAWLWFNHVASFEQNFMPIAIGRYVVCAAIGGVLVMLFRKSSASP